MRIGNRHALCHPERACWPVSVKVAPSVFAVLFPARRSNPTGAPPGGSVLWPPARSDDLRLIGPEGASGAVPTCSAADAAPALSKAVSRRQFGASRDFLGALDVPLRSLRIGNLPAGPVEEPARSWTGPLCRSAAAFHARESAFGAKRVVSAGRFATRRQTPTSARSPSDCRGDLVYRLP